MHCMVPRFASLQLRQCCHHSITPTFIIPIRCHIQVKKIMVKMLRLTWKWVLMMRLMI